MAAPASAAASAAAGAAAADDDEPMCRYCFDGGEDERVLLRILQSLDKAYTAKFEQQLEAARADLLAALTDVTRSERDAAQRLGRAAPRARARSRARSRSRPARWSR